MKKKQITFMSAVAKDIIHLEFRPEMTLKQVRSKFFCVMRKYGIKQGTKDGKVIRISNSEWTVCHSLFLRIVESHFRFQDIGGVPKDLTHYKAG